MESSQGASPVSAMVLAFMRIQLKLCGTPFMRRLKTTLRLAQRSARSRRRPFLVKSCSVSIREVHRKAALAAELSGKSLNQWAEEVLDRAAG